MWTPFKKKKKTINTDNIKDFNNVIKVIEDFMLFEEFDKAQNAITEVLWKENESFKYYIETIPEKQKKGELEKFKRKIGKLDELKQKNDKLKVKYTLYIKKKKQSEEMKVIKRKIKELSKTGNFDEAINLINSFMDKNTKHIEIVNFANKVKKDLSKDLEKYRIKKKKEIRNDALKEAQELIGEIKSNQDINKDTAKKNLSFLNTIKDKINFYGNFKKRLKDKRLLDEVNILLQTQNEKNELSAQAKLAQVHSGISREIYGEKINGYELYGKIMGADKISGDNLGFHKTKNDYTFFIGDATGHGIRAGFIISSLTKKFHELVNKLSLENLTMEINNALKQDLNSGNFITSIFFHIQKKVPNTVSFVGMGHEPIFIYRKQTGRVEKIIPGGLASGIRIIKDITSIKKKDLIMEDGDILMTYTDGIVEAKNENGEMYSIERIAKKLEDFGKNSKLSLEDLYKKFIDDLKNFTGGKANYNDDVTIMLLKRDVKKDILDNDADIENIILQQGLSKKHKNKIAGKSLEEIQGEIQKIQKEEALKNIIKSLDLLYKTGELPKMKTDCIRYIKEGYIHAKINFYLKKALDNENAFKINQKNKKMQDKYNVLKELYKKGDFETVISECSSIISKDGNI